MTIVVIVVVWTFVYNMIMKDQAPAEAFFRILDTISDDFVVGTFFTISVGVGIVIVFSITKLYTQVIANIYSFRILEDLFYNDFRQGHLKSYFSKLLNFGDLPQPESPCPQRVASLLFSFSFMYLMSWIYVVLFSEALFFVSWSAGVDLDIVDTETVVFLPTLALAIPFSARVMAYLRYPYAQDYADFMPGAVFVLLLVAALGKIYQSDDQVFFLVRVWQNETFRETFLKNGAFLAFIPVFFECGFWLIELARVDRREDMQP